jgi:hypothetical protein
MQKDKCSVHCPGNILGSLYTGIVAATSGRIYRDQYFFYLHLLLKNGVSNCLARQADFAASIHPGQSVAPE